MSICIGTGCYEKVTKDNTLYLIRTNVLKLHSLSEITEECKLVKMAEFIFDIVKKSYGNFGCTEELLLRKKC
jgi:hypothetical protein